MRYIPCIALSLLALLPMAASAADSPRERVSFNSGWRFLKEDHPTSSGPFAYANIKAWILPTGDDLLNYRPTKRERPSEGALPENADPAILPSLAFVRPNYDDSSWRSLNLPHDWGIEGPFQQELSGDTGKLPWFGVAWYRKTFAVPASDAGRQTYLEIDGAMSYASVWCNGELVGGWPFGYTSWRVDLTKFLRPGEDNVLAIRLDNPRESSRWYPGGGLYRNVWLLKTAQVAVSQWGVFVTTPAVTRDSATVNVNVSVDSRLTDIADIAVAVQLFEADREGRPVGEPVAKSDARAIKLAAGRQANLSHTLTVSSPKFWDITSPQRYVATTIVTQADRETDRVQTPFGIRTIEHTANDGFLLNGKRVPIHGVCMHHDLGALGAAVNFRALERQLEILQSMGTNAIRTSHNPPTPELLELCDRMGFVVMVEAFDCWARGKKREDYSRIFHEWHEKDLIAMVRRDRNHPSVIQWSIGNEIREQNDPEGWKLAAHLTSIVREQDTTRPVVAGLNNTGAAYNGFQHAIDIVGFNYKPEEYAKLRERHPHLLQMGAETASTISSRGEYFFPVSNDKQEGRADFQMSSYDLYAPRWASSPDVEWKALDENPFTLGEYVWTGFDYLGEPTPYNNDVTNLLNFSDPAERAKMEQELQGLGKIAVPSRSSYFGIVDLAGFPKDRYYLYQARWLPNKPMAHILPHWNWPERVDEVTPVFVYSSGDEAELFLNGKSLGRKKRAALEYRFRWDDVVYAPGELKVVTYKNGAPWAEAVKRTTGDAAKLTLAADRSTVRADGHDLSFITVTVADQNGELVPRSKNEISFTLTGPGEILATDNGDPTSFESFQAPQRKAFNGLALVIVCTKPGQAGAITVRAQSAGLTAAEITINSQ